MQTTLQCVWHLASWKVTWMMHKKNFWKPCSFFCTHQGVPMLLFKKTKGVGELVMVVFDSYWFRPNVSNSCTEIHFPELFEFISLKQLQNTCHLFVCSWACSNILCCHSFSTILLPRCYMWKSVPTRLSKLTVGPWSDWGQLELVALVLLQMLEEGVKERVVIWCNGTDLCASSPCKELHQFRDEGVIQFVKFPLILQISWLYSGWNCSLKDTLSIRGPQICHDLLGGQKWHRKSCAKGWLLKALFWYHW